MLAELAAFNLAVATVKEAAQHSGDIIQIFKGMGEMMSAKDKVQKVVTEKGQSDLEAYAAYAEMKRRSDEVTELLKWTGHWNAYLDFCKKRREEEKQREIDAARAKRQRIKKIKEIILITALAVSVLAGVGILAGLIWLVKTQGRGV